MIEKGYISHIFICQFSIIGSKDLSLSSIEMISGKVKTKKSKKKGISSSIFNYYILLFRFVNN